MKRKQLQKQLTIFVRQIGQMGKGPRGGDANGDLLNRVPLPTTEHIRDRVACEPPQKYPPKCFVRKLFTLLGRFLKIFEKMSKNILKTMSPYRVQYTESESDIKNYIFLYKAHKIVHGRNEVHE